MADKINQLIFKKYLNFSLLLEIDKKKFKIGFETFMYEKGNNKKEGSNFTEEKSRQVLKS